MELFQSEFLRHGITRIWGAGQVAAYLIEGSEKAILIDTSTGAGNLREYVERLTEKNLSILLTHGHMDHVLGASVFEGTTIYLHPDDIPVYRLHTSREYLDLIWAPFLGPTYEQVRTVLVEPKMLPTTDLADGMIFDLGGISIQIIAVPGHTRGSVAVLIPEERILIIGDACSENTPFYDEHTACIEEYRESLIHLKETVDGKYDVIYFMHPPCEGRIGFIESGIKLCEDIMNGISDDIPDSFAGMPVFLAKARDEHFRRLDGGLANFLYQKNRIWKNQIKDQKEKS